LRILKSRVDGATALSAIKWTHEDERMMNMNIEIANRLVQLRKANNLSQEDLADKIGVSRQAVSKWERAEASPDTDNLIMLAKIYGVSLDEMLHSEDEPVRPEPEKPAGAPVAEAQEEPAKNPRSILMIFPYPILCVILFFLIGFWAHGWPYAWLIFLTIPLYYSVAGHIGKKR
jgi:transcriptional regulator with XRE-family HTH domain